MVGEKFKPTRIQVEDYLDDLIVEIIVSQSTETLEKMRRAIRFADSEYGYEVGDYIEIYKELCVEYGIIHIPIKDGYDNHTSKEV